MKGKQEWEMKNMQRRKKSCTHLAASRSSSFLYSPKWLQKIMVSEAGRMKDVQQQQEARVTTVQRTADSPARSNTHAYGHRCTNALSFSASLALSPSLSSGGGGVAKRAPLPPDETVTSCGLWTRHRCLGYGRRTDAYPRSLYKLNGSLSPADRRRAHTRIHTRPSPCIQ